MIDLLQAIHHNRTRLITLGVLGLLFVTALQGMDPEDWGITVLRGLSVGMVTFLVAAGLSLILGLMDVLNLAHGEMFMLGAYVGWTVYVRPDTFVDVLAPVSLLASGLVLLPVWQNGLGRRPLQGLAAQAAPWLGLAGGVAFLAFGLDRYPIAVWNHRVYAESPITYSLALSQGRLAIPSSAVGGAALPLVGLLGILAGGVLLSGALAAWRLRGPGMVLGRQDRRPLFLAGGLALLGLVIHGANTPLTELLLGMGTTLRFFLAMGVATATGFLIGALVEVAMIRPLYERPVYQILLTLGLGFVTVEGVRSLWGRPEFTMPKPALFSATGDGCPATSLGQWFIHHCSTILLFGGRVRSYNEIFIVTVGALVLVGVWLLLRRTRVGMIIRAGVQDREMVEALGINVHRVFTFVFALGVGLAALGGTLAAPSIGLANDMGARLLLLALIALAIGGLTSFPGAAAGAILVGLLQQFIIKYSAIGIPLPFLEEPFKPSPPLVPASTVLLMVIILLVLPQGLFGRQK